MTEKDEANWDFLISQDIDRDIVLSIMNDPELEYKDIRKVIIAADKMEIEPKVMGPKIKDTRILNIDEKDLFLISRAVSLHSSSPPVDSP